MSNKCQIKYKGVTYSEEDAKKVVSYHYLVEDNLISSSDNSISKKKNRIEIDTDKELLAKETIQKVNQDYGLGTNVVTLEDTTGIVSIDVNSIASSIINSEDSELAPDTTPYHRYTENLNESEETLEAFNNKASVMEQRFSNLGIATHIIFDGDMDSSGALLGTGSEEYTNLRDSGEINSGDAVIKVNPRALYKDTLLHEYGHLFIDLLGGMKNPRIKYAYAKIKNSAVANAVRSQYSELSGEEMDKEIMAQLIGSEATNIFEGLDQTDRTFLQKFIDWFKDSIRNLLGLSTDSVTSLANQMLNGDIEVSGSLSTTTQEFKGTKEVREARSKNLKNIEGAKKNLENIKNKLNSAILQIGRSEDPTKKEFRGKLKAISQDIDTLSKQGNLVQIGSFIENLTETSNDILEVLRENNDLVNSGQPVKLSFNLLNEIEMLNSLLRVLDDLDSSITSGSFKKEFADAGWDDSDTNAFITNVNNLKNIHNEIQDLHIKVGRHHIAEKLSKYSNRMIVTRRTELEKEFKSMFPIKPGETMKQYEARRQDYINERIVTELASLKQMEKDWILERLENSPADIGGFGSWVSDEKDLNSMVIQMASKLLDEADLKRDQQMLAYKLEAFEAFKEFDKATSGTDPKTKYKGLYQEGSDNLLYIAGEYDVEWYIQRTTLERKYLESKDKLGLDHVDTKKAQAELYKWQKENTINTGSGIDAQYIPIAKWKNKEYASIMADPKSPKAKMLKFLIDTSKKNHKMLHGNNSLIKTTNQSATEFIQAPSIGRSTFEKAVSGNIGANIKDSFERLYKAKTDDDDLIGQVEPGLEGEKEALKMMQDSKGNLRYGVPIHFRGKMEIKDVSYDLLSSVVIDSYMAMNYLHKSSLQVELELMKDITANKKVEQTAGFAKNPIFNAIDRTGQTRVDPIQGIKSNEYKVLSSIIENRLYGIKNINTEYAKLTSTLMSLSATTMLMLNLPSGMVNLLQGKVFNFIEGVSGEFYSTKDLKKAEALFFKDMKYWVDDIGRPVHTSKTNQLMELLNLQGEFKALSSKFIENSRFKALAKKQSGFAFNHIGEMYMHGTLMYAILGNIKVKNAKNEFIDINGKPTTQEKAMSLTEAITVNPTTNQLEVNKHVFRTSFGNSGFSLNTKDKGLLEVKALVNKIAHDLHGNYNDEIMNMAQRTAVGKMIFMLRKWMVPGFNRRWRGAVHFRTPTDKLQDEVDNFYSEDLQAFQEGYYTTALRLITNVLRDLKQLQFEAFSKNWNELSDRELANMRRFITEASVMLLTFTSSYILYALAKDIDDPIEREVLFHLTYYTRRMFSEFNFYSNPVEAFKIMSTPAASMAYVAKLSKFGHQVLSDASGIVTGEGPEYYERGPYDGKLKLWKRTVDITPGLNQYHRNIEESTSWLFNLY